MKLYKLDDSTYINLEAVDYVSIAFNGYATLFTSTANFSVPPGEWEKIKNQHLVSL